MYVKFNRPPPSTDVEHNYFFCLAPIYASWNADDYDDEYNHDVFWRKSSLGSKDIRYEVGNIICGKEELNLPTEDPDVLAHMYLIFIHNQSIVKLGKSGATRGESTTNLRTHSK